MPYQLYSTFNNILIINMNQEGSIASQRSDEVLGSGVLHGSVLGLILFLMFIDDIASRVPSYNLCLFADDTLLHMNDISQNNHEIIHIHTD